MKYVKFNKFQLELMGKLEWDFFFGTEEVIKVLLLSIDNKNSTS